MAHRLPAPPGHGCLPQGGHQAACLSVSVLCNSVCCQVSSAPALQVVARSAKFSLFDPAKEMVYIEMDREEKQQGKAAVDLVGSQVGKSGGAWITQALLLGLGSISAALPIISLTFTGVVVAWLRAVGRLGHQMQVLHTLLRGHGWVCRCRWLHTLTDSVFRKPFPRTCVCDQVWMWQLST